MPPETPPETPDAAETSPRDRNAVTMLLARVSAGDDAAQADLFTAVYQELRQIAVAKMAGLGPGQTLQATALVHEAYLKLAVADAAWDGRAHFFGAAARAMRNIIVDQIRRQASVRHGGAHQRAALDTQIAEPSAMDPDRILDIESALVRLERDHPRAARIVDLRFFVGLSDQETSRAMGLSTRTVYREWSYAKAWLRRELSDPTMME